MIALYDHIQELRAELRGCVMNRRERAKVHAELAKAIAEQAEVERRDLHQPQDRRPRVRPDVGAVPPREARTRRRRRCHAHGSLGAARPLTATPRRGSPRRGFPSASRIHAAASETRRRFASSLAFCRVKTGPGIQPEAGIEPAVEAEKRAVTSDFPAYHAGSDRPKDARFPQFCRAQGARCARDSSVRSTKSAPPRPAARRLWRP